MKLLKIMSTSFLALGISSAAIITQANPNAHSLTITNYTYQDSTVLINPQFPKAKCSSYLGELGITRARVRGKDPVPHSVDGIIVGGACSRDTKNCRADIYMNDHCGGEKIGTVIIDVDKGIKSKEILNNTYAIEVKGPFDFILTGGPEPSM